jgi:cytosine/adenosine deaminase-related metal-dependent hydrolase
VLNAAIEKRKGVLVPGYINAHCHLELSHLKGVIPSGTGLIEYIKAVIRLRDFPQEEIDNAISKADQEMSTNGIVAVGDISNIIDSLKKKLHSPIRYKTFVEAFDLFQLDQCNTVF